jgi:ATP-dependent DNA helicase RecG
MDIPTLIEIIAMGESEKLELKASFNIDAIISIASMANKKGGIVVIGVSSRSEIIGTDIKEETIQLWINEIKTKTEPSLVPEIESYLIENKKVAVISINEYPIKPVAVRGRYYLRKQNSNHQLSLAEINELFNNSLQTSWDSYPFKNASLEDLDIGKVQRFIEKVNEAERFFFKGNLAGMFKKAKVNSRRKANKRLYVVIFKRRLTRKCACRQV